MSLKKTESTQHKLKQTCQLRLWLIVGGVCSLGMGVLNILSSGYFEPYDGGQIILGWDVWDIVWHYQRRYPTCRQRISPKSHNNSGGGAPLPKRKLAHPRQRYRLAQLPNRHRIMRAVVISGNGVEVRQAVPVLVARTDIQTQQAGFLMIAQRLLRR